METITRSIITPYEYNIEMFLRSKLAGIKSLGIEIGTIYDVQSKNRILFQTGYPTAFSALPSHMCFKKGIKNTVFLDMRSRAESLCGTPIRSKESMSISNGVAQIDDENGTRYEKRHRNPILYLHIPNLKYDLLAYEIKNERVENAEGTIVPEASRIKETDSYGMEKYTIHFMRWWNKAKNKSISVDEKSKPEVDYRIICVLKDNSDTFKVLSELVKGGPATERSRWLEDVEKSC